MQILVHPKCNNLNFIDFQHVRGSDNTWFCFKCNTNILPFGKLNNLNFQSFILSLIEASSDANQNKENSTLFLKPPPNLRLLFNQFNDLSAESSRTNPENSSAAKIMTLMKYKKLKLILVLSHCFILTPVLL